VISGLNVFGEAGYATALDKVVNVHFSDGLLYLHFGAAAGAIDSNSIIHGITSSTPGSTANRSALQLADLLNDAHGATRTESTTTAMAA